MVSVEPESMAMISSGRSATESSVLPMVAAEFLQTMAMERRMGAMVECCAGICGGGVPPPFGVIGAWKWAAGRHPHKEE